MPSRRLRPDTAPEISLIGSATRLHREGLTRDEIVDQLRTLAGGRTDLLAAAARHHIGGFLADPLGHYEGIVLGGYLTLAGADPDVTVARADITRRNADKSAYTN